MALSVLKIGEENNYALYDSKTKTMILLGTEAEMIDWKHQIEDAEQKKSNSQYMTRLKKRRLDLLIKAGHSNDQATDFLKKRMPFLF